MALRRTLRCFYSIRTIKVCSRLEGFIIFIVWSKSLIPASSWWTRHLCLPLFVLAFKIHDIILIPLNNILELVWSLEEILKSTAINFFSVFLSWNLHYWGHLTFSWIQMGLFLVYLAILGALFFCNKSFISSLVSIRKKVFWELLRPELNSDYSSFYSVSSRLWELSWWNELFNRAAFWIKSWGLIGFVEFNILAWGQLRSPVKYHWVVKVRLENIWLHASLTLFEPDWKV